MTTTNTPNAAERPRRILWLSRIDVEEMESDGEPGYLCFQEIDSHRPAESVSADYPECSGDPACCPENEGFGCCKPNPQPSTPGAVSDEDVQQWGYALERCVESQRLLAKQIDDANPDDAYASMMVYDDISTLKTLQAALESFAKRSAGGGA